MLWNFILIGLIFGAAKKKYNPYLSSIILGAAKGVSYYIGSQSIIIAIIAFVVFSGLAAGIVYFLARVDKQEAGEDPYPKYGTKKKASFKWEYIPLTTIVVLLVFGEWMLSLMFIR